MHVKKWLGESTSVIPRDLTEESKGRYDFSCCLTYGIKFLLVLVKFLLVLVMCEEFFESQSLWILEVLKESK